MKRVSVRSALWMALILAAGGAWGQDATGPSAAGLDRIRTAAARKGVPESTIAPLLSRVNRLASEGLPTGRFIDVMVEGISKGASPQALTERADSLDAALVNAQRSLGQVEGRGMKDDFTGSGRNPIEDLSESIEAGLKNGDLEEVKANLQTESLSRLLAGADALAHLRAARFPAPAAERLLKAVSARTPDSEIRLLTLAVLSGRKQGLSDDAIAATMGRQMKGGMVPSAVAGTWGMKEGKDGAMQGMGQGQAKGMGSGGMGGGKH